MTLRFNENDTNIANGILKLDSNGRLPIDRVNIDALTDIGLMIASVAVSSTATVSCVSLAQTLLTATNALNTCYMWQWTGIRWVEIPFSTFGLVKIP